MRQGSSLLHLLASIGLVGLAFVIRYLAQPLPTAEVLLILFLLAIAMAAWVGGLATGLLATVLSLIAIDVTPKSPEPTVQYVLHMALLALMGVLLSFIVELRRRAVGRAETSAQEVRVLTNAQSEADERCRRIVETAQEGIWELDPKHRVTYVNPQLAEMLGYAPEELVGRPAVEFMAEDSRPAAKEAWTQKEGRPAQAELEMRRKDGSPLWTRASSTSIRGADGELKGAFSMLSDISEQKHAEEARRSREARRTVQLAVTRVLAEAATLQAAQVGVLQAICEVLQAQAGALWRLDDHSDGLRCVAFWRTPDLLDLAELEAATRGTSVSPGVGLPGRVWTANEPAWVEDLAEDGNFPRQAAALVAGLRSGVAFPLTLGRACIGVIELFTLTTRTRDPDLLERFAAIGDQIGQFLERKRGEEERLALLERESVARQEAEAAGRAKDEFLATLSHELRTPLNAIVGWAHLLRLGQLDEATARRAVEVIDRNARAQAQIVADVLDVSRIVRGQLRLDLVPVEMASVVEAALETMRPAAEAKEIHLESALAPGRVSADKDRLQQVVWNLLSNAIKFTPQGGRVAVILHRLPAQMELTVEDTGPGIAADFLPHVFERFRQQDSSSTRSHGGLGLGLALVRHLVEQHGGTAAGASAGEGQGASFTVRLPLVASGPETPPPRLDAAPAGTPLRLNGLSVLVVDDEPDARELISAALQAAGARVRTAGSADEALRAIAAERPAVLVSDLAMPDTDGYDFIRRLRALPEEEGGLIPAAALSGYARAEDARRALEAGYQTYLAKPARPRELAEAVASLAGSTRG